jgi:acetyltransferase-like isoleucine patch superfamily enzyme
MKLLNLILGNIIYVLHSFLMKQIFIFKGIKIGHNFYCEGSIKFRNNKVRSKVIFGNNLKIVGNIEIFIRENGSILIGDNVKIDDGVRLVAANDAKITIGSFSSIGKGTIVNAGKDVKIGHKNLISGYCYIQSSSHSFKKDIPIIEQAHSSKEIIIEDDVWLGAHAVILPGVKLSKGSIIGANSVINKNTDSNEIYAGSPAVKIGERKD